MRNLTAQERNDIALTIAGEIHPGLTRYGTDAARREIAAILGLIENRFVLNSPGEFGRPIVGTERISKYRTISDVVRQKSQFSTWTTKRKREIARENYRRYNGHILRAVDDFFSGYLGSSVPDATHYYSLSGMDGMRPPDWDADLVSRTNIGPHTFGYMRGAPQRVGFARSLDNARRNFAADAIPSYWQQSPEVDYQRAAISMMNGGILGLDGRTGFTAPIAERFGRGLPQTYPETPPTWHEYAQRYGEEVARSPRPTKTTETSPRLTRVPVVQPNQPRPQFEGVPIPRRRPDLYPGNLVPGGVPTDPIDTRAIRRAANLPRFGATPAPGGLAADPGLQEFAAEQARQRARQLSAFDPMLRAGVPQGWVGAAAAPNFAAPRDIGGLLGRPAWGGANLTPGMAEPRPDATGLYALQAAPARQTTQDMALAHLLSDMAPARPSIAGGPMINGLTPAERMAAIASAWMPKSNLDYRMAAIASDPNLNHAALESNLTYQAPQQLPGGSIFGQIGPDGLAGKPQYGGGLAAIRDPEAYAAEQQRQQRSRALMSDDVTERAFATNQPSAPTAIQGWLAGMDKLSQPQTQASAAPASTFPARPEFVAQTPPRAAAVPSLPSALPTIGSPEEPYPGQIMQQTIAPPVDTRQPAYVANTAIGQFPPAPPPPGQEESLLGGLLGPRMQAALMGASMAGLPGAIVGGLLGGRFGGVGGLLGNNGPIGPASAAERFNAGYGLAGINQGMYGPRGATGFSLSNPGSTATSRGPNQGYDLTSGKYGWREHYDANGNFRGISYADGTGGLLGGLSRAVGGLLGGDSGGKSGKGRKSDKDKDGYGAGLY